MGLMQTINDGFANLLTRVGVPGYDKNTATTYQVTPINAGEVEAAYRTSLLRKIVDIPPYDMTREWRNWNAKPEQITALEDEEKRLGMRFKLRQALAWARLYGGAGLYLGIKGQGTAAPLDPEAIQQGGLQFVHVYDRFTLTAGEMDRDVNSPNYGLPSVYQLSSLNGRQVDIHPSRIVRFTGSELPIRQAQAEQGWGDSIYTMIKDELARQDSAAAGGALMMTEAKRDIVRIKNFMSNIATTEGETRMVRRMGLVAQAQSMLGVTMLDADDEWSQKTIPFGSVPDMIKVYMARLAGVADIPATRLWGKSPDGMNATGESDLINYYDMIRSRQNDELTPQISVLDEILIRSALGDRPKEIFYTWSPLWQESPADKADRGLKRAQATQIYVNSGLIPDSALSKGVQNQLIEDETYPGLEQAIKEAEAAGDVPAIETQREQEAESAEAQNEALRAKAKGKPELKLVKGGAADAFVWADSGQFLTDATPRPLYVRRQVLNAPQIRRWAESQGFADISDDLHVTIAFSRVPIDWMSVPPDWAGDEKGNVSVRPGGPRIVERMGEWSALLFRDTSLEWRHEDIIRKGASWDWPDYQPHISISKGPIPADVQPYVGPIMLGPEIFEEAKD